MHQRNPRPFFFWSGIAVLSLLLAGLALGSAYLPGDTSPTPAPAVPPSATASAQSAEVLDQSRGLIALSSPEASAIIRRETVAEPLASLRGHGLVGAVSGTGRRVAYWVTSDAGAQDLRVFDVTAPDQDTTLATVLADEHGTSVVWSSDRSGVAVAVEATGRSAGGQAPAPFSALRTVDTPSRQVHEIARITDGGHFVPIAWDRDAQLVGACVVSADGSAMAWATVGEDAQISRAPMDSTIPAATVEANGSAVLGVQNAGVVRVWSVTSYDQHRELGATADERIAFARWRPGGTDIVVSVADRLELWPAAGGAHRVVARGLQPASGLLVTVDGAAAVVSFDSGRGAVAVDLGSGRTAPVPMAGEQLLAAISFH